MDVTDFTDQDGRLVRTMLVRDVDPEARTFTGIGVPYGEEITHYFGRETFAPGSVELDPAGARIMSQHRDPIGVVVKGEDTTDGYRVTGRISKTATGDETLTLMRDGALRSLSIGFDPQEWTTEARDDGDELLTWTRVTAREFSIVTFPAYEGAALETVRKRNDTPKENNMSTDALTRDNLDEALAPFKADMEDTIRKALTDGGDKGPALPQYRSVGEFAKALAAGNNDAAELHRAYTGGTTADTVMKDSPLGDFTRLITERRPLINQFSTGPLPADGLGVDYVQLKADTTAVAEQEHEGDDLAKGKLTKELKRATIHTFGGWTELSRQEIERASVEVLNTTLQALALRYAKVTNAYVRGVYTDQIAAHLTTGGDAVVSVADPTDPFDFLDAVLDAADVFEDRGFQLSRLDASKSVFKKLIRLTTPERLLTDVNGSQGRTISNFDLGVISGDLAGIRVNLLPNMGTEDVAAFVDPVAVRTLENSTPWQLQDENIINLTKQFSVYGYLAAFVPYPDAIVPLQLGAAG